MNKDKERTKLQKEYARIVSKLRVVEIKLDNLSREELRKSATHKGTV